MDRAKLEKAVERFLQAETPEEAMRPEMLEKAVPIYEHGISELPDAIRVSFSDGRTAVYERRAEMPPPLIVENIRIIRKWKTGYQAPGNRRRRI